MGRASQFINGQPNSIYTDDFPGEDFGSSGYLFFFFSSRRRHTRCSRDWSSDVCSSDLFTVKVLDVYPGGRAYNLDETIQRMRYRDGYDKPLVWMESGKVYKVTLQPLKDRKSVV